jgi:hypothetical protein
MRGVGDTDQNVAPGYTRRSKVRYHALERMSMSHAATDRIANDPDLFQNWTWCVALNLFFDGLLIILTGISHTLIWKVARRLGSPTTNARWVYGRSRFV